MKRMRTLPVILALLAIGAAWTGCTGSDGEEEVLKGFIQNTCGRADGPAVYLLLGKHLDTACLAEKFNQTDTWGIHRDDYQVETLKPGTRLMDSVMDCEPYNCVSVGTLQVLILENREGTVIGSYELKLGKGDTAKIRSGPAYLKKCPQVGGCL